MQRTNVDRLFYKSVGCDSQGPGRAGRRRDGGLSFRMSVFLIYFVYRLFMSAQQNF